MSAYQVGEVYKEKVRSAVTGEMYEADLFTADIDRIGKPQNHWGAIMVCAETAEQARALAARVADLLNQHGDGAL